MKKNWVLIIALTLICFGFKAIAVNPDDVCYVKTADKVYFGQDVKMGLVYTKVISADGTVAKLKTKEIKAVMHENKLYELLPVVCERYDTLCYAMLEYVTSRSGLKLYKYCCVAGRDEKYGYFVFKDNKFYLRVDQNNAVAILPFFGIELI